MSISSTAGRGSVGPVITGTVGATSLPFTGGNETLTIVALVAIGVGAVAILSRVVVYVSRFMVR